ncbi:MAG TPA: site-specific DNA-methyltransferase [candidate division Zixibacteria bacterium]|nr:site-specific DNA-methyltransferase [candidate division Zixibacteria bacterium]MDD4918277.1 site-specific DNA-methyltransferase [candidate division Zixibacteria bacterium]MDM7973176.1 site-specific DNA-methyltransferase [candidate division Zixibacteria bacterium]HOD65856.1 site-specific DNA-methyltransferase [candidate division Zixibacteria bacterium]HOZ07748.1 site-specific DNA-methyltransferase [candidate division Zixibacteria bacterium]
MHYRLLARLDSAVSPVRPALLPYCRLRLGEVWCDPEGRHTVACGDAADRAFVRRLFGARRATLAVQDPPYNLVMGQKLPPEAYANWCRAWVDNTDAILADAAALYIWLGADQDRHFQPLPQVMAMMAATGFASRSLITMRNQRGYGTQRNWMAVRQELLYYVKGEPPFSVQYTGIPKTLRGYYKTVGGKRTENTERGRGETIRPGNVWVDIQQVFYRREENVNGCYAQKPLAAIERIVLASSRPGELVADFFSHAGTTLVACERLGRSCVTFDIDPIFAEITIRRLERYRAEGRTGWQAGHPFERELQLKRHAASACAR